jgi:hypothetical protein
MRHSKLLIGTLALGLLALATVRFTREVPPSAAPSAPLIAPAVFDGLRTLVVKANQKSVTIEKTASGWAVKEKLGLPADLENRFIPLVRALQKARNLGQLTANPKRLEKLGLADSAVELTTTDGQVTRLEFGKQTEDGVGAAARLAGQTIAIRTDFSGYLEGDPLSWADLTLVTVKPAEVKSVVFTWQDGQASFGRKESGAPFEGKNAPAAEELVSAIATLRAADALPHGDADAAKATRLAKVTLTLFNGATVDIAFTRTPGTSPTDAGKTFVQASHSDPAHQANTAVRLAVFVAAPWMVEQLPASLKAFQQGPGQPTEPSAPPPPGPAATIAPPTETKAK